MWFAKLVWSSAGWIPPLLGSEIKTVIHSHEVPNSLAAPGMCWLVTTAAFPFGTKISFGAPVFQLVYENSRTHHGTVPLGHKEERVIEKEDRKGPEKLTKPQWLVLFPYIDHSDFSDSLTLTFFFAATFPYLPPPHASHIFPQKM